MGTQASATPWLGRDSAWHRWFCRPLGRAARHRCPVSPARQRQTLATLPKTAGMIPSSPIGPHHDPPDHLRRFRPGLHFGIFLYQTKHRVTVIDHEIADVVHQTGVIRKQIPILAADGTCSMGRIEFSNSLTVLHAEADRLVEFAALDELDSRLPPIPSPDGTPVAGAAPPSEPPSVPSSDVIAQNAPVLMATAQVPPATRSVPAPSPAAVTIGSPAPSPAAATAESQPANQDTEDARPAIDVSEAQQPHEAEAQHEPARADRDRSGPIPSQTPLPYPRLT